MWGKIILHDLLTMLLLLLCSLGLGLIVNECRNPVLPLVYSSPEVRLNTIFENISASKLSAITLGADVDKKEMRKISENHSALILDARPLGFYELGHIPSALSLPRNDFKSRYQSLQKTLLPYLNKTIVIYCSDSGCHDSKLVGEALCKLGYQNVRLFRGGWDEWVDSELPTNQECHCGD